jgi:hypothetical protein
VLIGPWRAVARMRMESSWERKVRPIHRREC